MPTLGGEPRMLKRAAVGGRPSPDGKWLAYISLHEPGGIRIASMTSSVERTIGRDLLDVSFVIWSPDSTHVLVQAHADPTAEPDYWIVPIHDGARAAANTGIMQRLRQRGYFNITLPASWANDSVIFSVITTEGVRIARQALSPKTLQPNGRRRAAHARRGARRLSDRERRTRGVRADARRSEPLVDRDRPDEWHASGPLRRLTRGPGFIAQLSATRDGRTLVLLSRPSDGRRARAQGPGDRLGGCVCAGRRPRISGDVAERPMARDRWREAGPRAMRPIYIGSVADGETRKLADDCGGRPRQWLDERLLVIERFGSRLNSIALLDTTEGDQRELLVERGPVDLERSRVA